MNEPRPLRPLAAALVRAGPARGIVLLAALIVFFLLLLFAGEVFWIRSAVLHTSASQHNVRQAQELRDLALRQQLDEETGLRGYIATGDRTFLQPYLSARTALPRTFTELGAALHALGLPTTALSAENSINGEWLREVAEPLIANPNVENLLAVQLRGKDLIDAYRAANENIGTSLYNEANAIDDEANTLITRIIQWSLGIFLGVAAVIALLGFVQGRLVQSLQEQHQALRDEKRIADRLQGAFALKRLPAFPNVRFDAVYLSSEHGIVVGGDWYDVFEIPGNRIFFSLGDVAGHGVDAAVVMTRTRQAMLAASIGETQPAAVLHRANQVLLLQGATMVTAICGYIDSDGTRIDYACAGHPPPLLGRPGKETEALPHSGPPLGLDDGPQFENFSYEIPAGSLLVMYTDGLVEYNRDIIRGEALLKRAVARVALRNPPDAAAAIVRSVFYGARRPKDDVAVLAARFQGATGGLEIATPVTALRSERAKVSP